MKLLFDENISYRIVKKLEGHFAECTHVSNHKLMHSSDIDVRNFAIDNDYIIVTNDSDFNDMASLYGFPPKIIWFKTGNVSTERIADYLIQNKSELEFFQSDSSASVYVISKI